MERMGRLIKEGYHEKDNRSSNLGNEKNKNPGLEFESPSYYTARLCSSDYRLDAVIYHAARSEARI